MWKNFTVCVDTENVNFEVACRELRSKVKEWRETHCCECGDPDDGYATFDKTGLPVCKRCCEEDAKQ